MITQSNPNSCVSVLKNFRFSLFALITEFILLNIFILINFTPRTTLLPDKGPYDKAIWREGEVLGWPFRYAEKYAGDRIFHYFHYRALAANLGIALSTMIFVFLVIEKLTKRSTSVRL